MEPTKCNHTYTTLGNRVFRCDAKPHPTRPEQHYFVRDEAEQDRRNAEQKRKQRRNGLVVIPGARRD